MDMTQEQEDRFWDKVNKGAEGCWEWTGATNRRGCGDRHYGLFKIPLTRKNITAHRLSYILTKGEIPDGMFVCHTCDNPSCVNPDHLFLGTAQDNVDDMDRKGRRKNPDRSGEKNGRAILTDTQVSEIRELKARFTLSCLAKMFGVGKSQIHRIVTNQVRANP